jgi:hypothetical protein
VPAWPTRLQSSPRGPSGHFLYGKPMPLFIHKAFVLAETSRGAACTYERTSKPPNRPTDRSSPDRINAVFGANAEFQHFDAPLVSTTLLNRFIQPLLMDRIVGRRSAAPELQARTT